MIDLRVRVSLRSPIVKERSPSAPLVQIIEARTAWKQARGSLLAHKHAARALKTATTVLLLNCKAARLINLHLHLMLRLLLALLIFAPIFQWGLLSHELKNHHVAGKLLRLDLLTYSCSLMMLCSFLLGWRFLAGAGHGVGEGGATPRHFLRQPVVVDHEGAHRDRIPLRCQVALLLLLKDKALPSIMPSLRWALRAWITLSAAEKPFNLSGLLLWILHHGITQHWSIILSVVLFLDKGEQTLISFDLARQFLDDSLQLLY